MTATLHSTPPLTFGLEPKPSPDTKLPDLQALALRPVIAWKNLLVTVGAKFDPDNGRARYVLPAPMAVPSIDDLVSLTPKLMRDLGAYFRTLGDDGAFLGSPTIVYAGSRLMYAGYRNSRIEVPHDFSGVTVSVVYRPGNIMDPEGKIGIGSHHFVFSSKGEVTWPPSVDISDPLLPHVVLWRTVELWSTLGLRGKTWKMSPLDLYIKYSLS